MKRTSSIFTIAAFSLLVIGLPVIAAAQWGGNGGYYPNGGNNNGGYGNNGYYGDIRGTLQDLKSRTHNFEKTVDRDRSFANGGYNNGGYYNRNAYSDLKKMLDRLAGAASKLENRYGNGRDLNRSADVAREVLDLGTQANQMLYSFGNNGGYWQNDWNQIQNDLRVVSNTYGYNYNGDRRGNRNGTWGNRNGNGNRGNLPSWWPF